VQVDALHGRHASGELTFLNRESWAEHLLAPGLLAR
jgi:hypothetical protein